MTIKIDDLEEKLGRITTHLLLAKHLGNHATTLVSRMLDYEGDVSRQEVETVGNRLANQSVEFIHIERLLRELIC